MKNLLFTAVILMCQYLTHAQTSESAPPPPPPPPPPSVATNHTTDTNDQKVYSFVEQQPEFPGGVDAMMEYLSKNLNYPKEAREKGIQGTVFIKFIVETDGTVSDVKVLRGIGAGCDEESARVVESMPKWEPGEQGGEPVAVYYSIPIKFVLEKQQMKEDGKGQD